MNSWWTIFSASMAVYVNIGVGAVTRRIGWLTEEADHSLLRLTVRVLYPCLIFSSVSNNAALRGTANIALPPLLGFGTMALGFALSAVVASLGRPVTGLLDRPQRGTFAACVGIFNYGFIPVPLVQLLFDRPTLGVLFVHNVGADLAVWTLGMMLFGGDPGRRWWQHMINAPSITIVLALATNLLGLAGYLPAFICQALEWLGHAGIPMSMILVGAIVADELQSDEQSQNTADSAKSIVWALVLRLGILPLTFLAIAAVLPASIELKRVLVIQAAMPCGTFPIVMARMYRGDPGVALRVVIGTSVVSLATIPLWIRAGLSLLGLGGG